MEKIRKYLRELKWPIVCLGLIATIIVGIMYYQHTLDKATIAELKQENTLLLDSNVVGRRTIAGLQGQIGKLTKQVDSLNRRIDDRQEVINHYIYIEKQIPEKIRSYNDSTLLLFYKNYFEKHEIK
jgi:peptidoglycan hydrolase CwlO-like protein